MFIRDLFVKEPIIKSLYQIVDRYVWKLEASKQILTVFYSCKLSWRVILDLSNWKISVKNLIIFLFSYCNTNKIFRSIPIPVWGDNDWSDISQFCWYNFNLQLSVFVLPNYLVEILCFWSNFGLRCLCQFIQDLFCWSLRF